MWGCVIPLAVLRFLLWRKMHRAARFSQFFAGFCLIANGAYLGVGSFIRAGDAGDLFRYGTPQWLLIAFGVVTMSGGLYLWHRLGSVAPVSDRCRHN